MRIRQVVTPERCIREEHELQAWTPLVTNLAGLRPGPTAVSAATQHAAVATQSAPVYGGSGGPIRHSSRLQAAASPYALRPSPATPAR